LGEDPVRGFGGDSGVAGAVLSDAVAVAENLRAVRSLRGIARCLFVVAASAFAGAAPAFDSAVMENASEECLVDVLGELGWRFERGDVDDVSIVAGTPCERESLTAAHAAGDLRVSIPAAADPAENRFASQWRLLLDHPATHCGFSFRLGDATRKAVDRLVANENFRFTALQTGWIGFGWGGADNDGWQSIRTFGRGFTPKTRPSLAIEGFYSASVRAECGVGRQIAQYAALYELFGAQGFDNVFERNEIVIGTFNQLNASDSILLGRSAGEFTRDGRAEAASAMGKQAFSGLPGFIFHVFDASTLDDVSNQAENFVVYRVSDRAARSLRQHNGFEHFNDINRRIWELSVPLELTAHRIFERLLYERDAGLRAAIAPEKLRVIERIDELLADPFYREFEIYVHPRGVKPVGYHIARLLDRNPRTPFRIELGLHNLHTTVFERWVGWRIEGCSAD
jgi:hypothetical protein